MSFPLMHENCNDHIDRLFYAIATQDPEVAQQHFRGFQFDSASRTRTLNSTRNSETPLAVLPALEWLQF